MFLSYFNNVHNLSCLYQRGINTKSSFTTERLMKDVAVLGGIFDENAKVVQVSFVESEKLGKPAWRNNLFILTRKRGSHGHCSREHSSSLVILQKYVGYIG